MTQENKIVNLTLNLNDIKKLNLLNDKPVKREMTFKGQDENGQEVDYLFEVFLYRPSLETQKNIIFNYNNTDRSDALVEIVFRTVAEDENGGKLFKTKEQVEALDSGFFFALVAEINKLSEKKS